MKQIKSGLFALFKYSLLFIAIYSAVNWWRKPVPPANPELKYSSIYGETIDIENISQQQTVLIYFWGSWCGICRLTSPNIEALHQAGYPVISIAVQSGNAETVQQYLQQQHYHFPTINDEHGDIFADWQGKVTPSFVLLKNGKMEQGLTGFQPLWALKLRLWLNG